MIVSKLGRRSSRKSSYMSEHRAAWAEAGFSSVTMMLHEKDKDMMRAYAEVSKHERLLKLVKTGDKTALSLAASRNKKALPSRIASEELRSMVEYIPDKGTIAEVKSYLASYMRYARDAAELVEEADLETKFALTITNVNLAVAYYSLATVITNAEAIYPMGGEDV